MNISKKYLKNKNIILFTTFAVLVLLTAMSTYVYFFSNKLYSEMPQIDIICSSCHKGKTNCVYPLWYKTYRDYNDFVEVCDKNNYCKWRDVKKGGEWFYKFTWSHKTETCNTSSL